LPLSDLPTVNALIARVEQTLGADGRVLVRYSGTEHKARGHGRRPDEVIIRGYADEIATRGPVSKKALRIASTTPDPNSDLDPRGRPRTGVTRRRFLSYIVLFSSPVNNYASYS